MLETVQMMFGALGGLLETALGIAVLFVIAFMFPPIRRRILKLVNLVPAAVLYVVGVIAIPLWGLMNFLVGLVLNVVPLDAMLAGLVERSSHWFLPAGRRTITAMLVRGERLAAAQAFWPETDYPDLYREVPDDVVRPPYDDGRLIAGVRLGWLTDRYMTQEVLRSAARVALTLAALAFIVVVAWHLFAVFEVVKQTAGELKS